MSLERIKTAVMEFNRTLFLHGSPWETPEGYSPLNAASRNLVAAYVKEYGQAHVGLINRSNKRQPWMWEIWTPSEVDNFGADFVLPARDDQLKEMLQARYDAEYTGVAADAIMVDRILQRIAAVGGHCLHWS